MIRGLGILVGLLFAGEAVSRYLHLPIPGNVIGFALLFLLLISGIVSLDKVEESADLLVKNMLFLFLPAVVSTVTVFGVINRQLAAFVVASFASTFLVMVVSAKVVDLLARRAVEAKARTSRQRGF